MRFWFARGSEVPIREQLVTQVVLGILSGDLQADQRLPSTRELARRFQVHPNTISSGYRQLARSRWVEFRRGSGVYVRSTKPETATSPALAIDQMIARLFRSARKIGVSSPALRSRLRQWLELQPPDHFLLIEPDPELRAILIEEVSRVVNFPVQSCGIENCPKNLDGAVPIVLPNRAATVRQTLPAGAEIVELQVRSAQTSLSGYLPAPSGALVGIASRWPEFLKVSRALLNAAGFHPDSLIFCDAREPNWQRGLKETAAVVCDVLTERELPKGCRALAFSLLSEASVTELRACEEFIRQPFEAV